MSDNQHVALVLLGMFTVGALIYAAGSWLSKWADRSIDVAAALNGIDDRENDFAAWEREASA